MASNLYGNGYDGDSDNSFGIDSDDDDNDLYNGDFQPVTEDMLTLEITRGLDDIFTGERCMRFIYNAQTDLINRLLNGIVFFFGQGRSSKTRWTRHISQSDLRFIADSEFSLYINTAGLPYLRELLYDSEHCKHSE